MITVSRRNDRIRQFYEAHRRGLYAYALALTGDRARAEDAVHTAIAKLVARPLLPLGLRR